MRNKKTISLKPETRFGFTLLEVLVSLAIVGILIVTILESENLNLKVRENSYIYTHLFLSGNSSLSSILNGEETIPNEEIEVKKEEEDFGEKVMIKVKDTSGVSLILHTYLMKKEE